MQPLQIDASLVITVLVNLGGLAAIYTGLKVQIEVLVVKVELLQRELQALKK